MRTSAATHSLVTRGQRDPSSTDRQGTVVTPLLNAILSSIRDGDVGAASGVLSTMQQVGGALGIAVVGILFFGALDGAQAGAEVYAHAFLLAALYTVLAYAVTLALLLRLPDGRVG